MFFPNSRGKRLFGVLHEAHGARNLDLGVVFCHPFGEEKHKSYRVYTQFSRYLAAAGIPSLRFDCWGFGDSDGDLFDATIESQVADTRDALARLRSELGISRCVLLGTRLGATVAALAAAADGVHALILVSPVVSGETYWAGLIRTHQFSLLARGRKPMNRDALLSRIAEQGYLEIDAERVSAELIRQLTAVDLLEHAGNFRGAGIVTARAADQAEQESAAALVEAWRRAGCDVAGWLDEPRDFWTSKSLFDGHCPTDFYARTVAWLGRVADDR